MYRTFKNFLKSKNCDFRILIYSFHPHVNDITERNLAQAPDSSRLTPFEPVRVLWGIDHKTPASPCVCWCVTVPRCVTGCHVAPSNPALLCQEIRTQGKPLAVPACWIPPLNLLLLEVAGLALFQMWTVSQRATLTLCAYSRWEPIWSALPVTKVLEKIVTS